MCWLPEHAQLPRPLMSCFGHTRYNSRTVPHVLHYYPDGNNAGRPIQFWRCSTLREPLADAMARAGIGSRHCRVTPPRALALAALQSLAVVKGVCKPQAVRARLLSASLLFLWPVQPADADKRS